jgi:hypothetical protein
MAKETETTEDGKEIQDIITGTTTKKNLDMLNIYQGNLKETKTSLY